MPFITTRTNRSISREQEQQLKSHLGRAIELVPGKSEQYLMAEKVLQHDVCMARNLSLRSLPAYMLHYGSRHVLIHDMANYDAFASAIRQLTGGSISPTLPEVNTESLRRLITRHPLISPIEISQAFNLHTAEEVKQFIQPLIAGGEISVREVPHGLFIKKNNK